MLAEAWVRPPMDQGVTMKARWVSRPLSPMMENLAVMMAGCGDDILADQRGGFCVNTHKNFVGSLLMAANRELFTDAYTRMEIAFDRTVSRSVEIVPKVPLYLWNQDKNKYVAVGESAGPVMVKHACGRETGVVLEGSYAGLMLRAKGIRDVYNYAKCGMCVNRVFNDDRANDRYPYSANFPLYLYRGNVGQKQPANYLTLDKMFSKIIWDYFDENAADNDVYLTDLFFSLCNDLNIPVDVDSFHFTRSVNK